MLFPMSHGYFLHDKDSEKKGERQVLHDSAKLEFQLCPRFGNEARRKKSHLGTQETRVGAPAGACSGFRRW